MSPILLFLLLACDVDWQPMQNGIDHREIRCLGDDNDLDMHVVRIDPRKWSLETAISSGATARSVAKQNDSPFAINANFFDADRKPLGAIVRDGSVVRAPKSSSWQSIFLITQTRARIIVPAKWAEYRKSALMAVQAGPRLVIDGHTNRVHQSYAAARAGVCIQWDRDVLFFATPQSRKFDMYEIARIARIAEKEGGLACRDAMLFDGGHSVNLFVDGEERDVDVRGDAVPVFVYAKPK